MNRILLVTIAILMLATVGIVGCSQESSQQMTVPSPPPPPKQEVQKSETPPQPETGIPSQAIPYKEGYDPVTGKPIENGHEEAQGQIYGTPPPQESYPKMSSGYPNLAKLPPGADGKVQVAYNYVVEYPGRYRVNLQVTNLSNRPLEGFYYDEFLKDGGDNVLNEVRNEGHHNAPPRFPLQPGNSVILETSKVAFSGSFGSSPIETWKVEIDVTYLKFE